jgi:hypothetical protein
VWGIKKLRAYIATVKSRFRPTISHDASILLERHYTFCRSSVDMAIQITVRFLESLIRLAQAHASLMHRNIVKVDDAVAVILLMESTVASTSHYSNDSFCSDPTADFPNDNEADHEFLLMKAKVLEKYGMSSCLSAAEYAFLTNEQNQSDHKPTINSWDYYQKQSVAISGNQISYRDHYGRFTQRTIPSPEGKENEFGHKDDTFDSDDYDQPR